MIAQRLKQLRLARGLSLDALAAELGGVVSKQSLAKYEAGKAHPSPVVLARLAETFGVKAAHLTQAPTLDVQFAGYRKRSRLGRKEMARVENLIRQEMELRVRLQELLGIQSCELPVQELDIHTVEDVERAAEAMREQWNLGLAPISILIETLESHCVHVVEIDAAEAFDGISVIVKDDQGRMVAAGAVTRRQVGGERQRFNVAHELGHLVLKIADGLDEEACAHRFAGAFLAPGASVRHEMGRTRAYIHSEELKEMARRYGISRQASLRRLYDLEIISKTSYTFWCRNFSRWGWRKEEPEQSQPEQPQWMRRTLLRLVAEGQFAADEAEQILGERIESGPVPTSLIEKRAFMKLPMEERRRILEQQAQRLERHYEQLKDVDDIQGGDIVDE